MAQYDTNDFGSLYRAAFAERDPEKKQILLSQVQKAISSSEQEEITAMVKLGPRAAVLPKVSAAA